MIFDEDADVERSSGDTRTYIVTVKTQWWVMAKRPATAAIIEMMVVHTGS